MSSHKTQRATARSHLFCTNKYLRPYGLSWNLILAERRSGVANLPNQKTSRVSPAAAGTAHTSAICPAPIRPINGFWLYQFSRPLSSEGGVIGGRNADLHARVS